MTSSKVNPFKQIAKEKGWLLEDIAERWGISVRQMSRVANNPKQRDLDAVNGLPAPKEAEGLSMSELTSISLETILPSVFVVRGAKAMLDSDLVALVSADQNPRLFAATPY